MKRGFTLIELLVSIAILGSLVIAGLVSFRRIEYQNNMRVNSERIREALTQARTYALAPPTQISPVSSSYGLEFDKAAGIIRFLGNNSSDPANPMIIGEAINLSPEFSYDFTPKLIDSLEPDPGDPLGNTARLYFRTKDGAFLSWDGYKYNSSDYDHLGDIPYWAGVNPSFSEVELRVNSKSGSGGFRIKMNIYSLEVKIESL